MSPPRIDPLIGQIIGGQYRVDAKLGEGGMGAVYRATQLAVNRAVAVKVLRAHVPEMERSALVERFRREAMATSKLRHPNTVSVYDFGETESGTMYLVLELLDGLSLSEVIGDSAPLPPRRVAYIGKQIAKSLAEAHECGIIHRDLKPDNIFVCHYHGDPDFTKVMDFGIARLISGDEGRDVTRTGMMVGTPRYIAPEQAMAKKVSPAADLYSLGVILYEMLSGRPPFEEESAMALALAHVNQPVPPLELPQYPPPLAEAWRGLVAGLLAKSPADRPQHAAELSNWLSQLELDARRWEERGRADRWTVTAMSAHGAPPATYEGPSPKSTVTVSREKVGAAGNLRIALAALAFMLLGGLVGYALLSGGDPAEPLPPSLAATSDDVVDERGAATAAGPSSPGATAAERAAAPVELPTMDMRPRAPVTEAPPARLILKSAPEGAQVHVGGRYLCTTPCDLSLEASGGPKRVRVSKPGYRDVTVFTELQSGETTARQVDLKPAPR